MSETSLCKYIKPTERRVKKDIDIPVTGLDRKKGRENL
jgi:hypothetical protein